MAIRVTYGLRKLDHLILVSAYFKFNVPTILHVERLNQILAMEKRTLIGADTNGHSKQWHSLSRNRRGRIVEEFVDNLPGHMNTFCPRDGRTSNIDATMTSADIGHMVRGWQVKDLTDSDHRFISFNLAITKPLPKAPTTTRYNTKTADWQMFNSALLSELGAIPDRDFESMAEGIDRVHKLAADLSMALKRTAGASGKNPWWSPALTTLLKNLSRAR